VKSREALKRLQEQWFLIALTVAVVAGFATSESLGFLTEYRGLRSTIVAGVMVLMAVSVPLGAFVRALRRPGAAILASLLNLGLAPLLAAPFIGFLGPQLGGGLAIALSVPCTLATAAVWTRRAGGNDVTALMVTVTTNLACVIITPLWLWWLTRQMVTNFSVWDQIQQLSLLVLLPIGCAQLARVWPRLADLATRRKQRLGLLTQCGVLYVVFLGAMQSASAWGEGQAAPWSSWGITLALIAGLHLGLFFIGLGVSRGVGMAEADCRAVAISGSQKTFMIGAEIGLTLGLSILPLLIYHVFQLFADTYLADRLRRQDQVSADCH
jgi:sodium/bile acid cotransporter 7